MRESAFKDPPWLIERDGAGYVQVTELLYRIAEQCDGSHSLDEIARAVSETTGRSVSADNVRLLVGTQLLLKGLVQTADGKVVGGQGGARSLLALNMRTKMIGPELLAGPTAALQWLFWPPALLALVGLAAGCLGWLFLVHGLAASARQALYTPGLLLMALALTALAAGFHELGHAAALRYGGGTPKGMGVGLYLVYPAFYTDVSDNYRLPRWARVRTDLGGVVFHLVFILGIVALYLATGWELLLVAVPLLMLDAFRQLLPMIRLDGYWTLADLTGVPDFLSYVGAFVRRVVPGLSEGQSRLPELKWWGTLAFGLYIVLVLPILGFLLFTMVRTTPTVLATAWDSAQQLWDATARAVASGDGIGVASGVAQLFVLALPTAGLLYSLGRFGKRIALAVWRWSSPTPTRRVVGALGTAAALGLVGYLWAPQLPFGGEPGPLHASTRAGFVPIPPDTRGTLFDAVGTQPPAWLTWSAPDADRPEPVPSPSPAAPGAGAASPQPAASPEAAGAPAATTAPAATSAPAATPVATVPRPAPTVPRAQPKPANPVVGTSTLVPTAETRPPQGTGAGPAPAIVVTPLAGGAGRAPATPTAATRLATPQPAPTAPSGTPPGAAPRTPTPTLSVAP
jgi:putative peptide zinc metalloprotease protein